MSNSKTLTDARFIPATHSFCLAHVVYKGGTKFDLNPQGPGGLRELDRRGRYYVILNVRGSRDVAKRVLREGLTVPFQVCPGCGRHIPAATRSTCKPCGSLLVKDRIVHKHFVAADGYVRAGDGTTLVLFSSGLADSNDVPRTPDEFRKDLGVAAEIHSDSDMLKFQKYFKRFLAPVRVSVSGPVVEWLENGFVCELWKRDEASGGLVCRKTFVHTPVVEGTFLEIGGERLPAEQFYDGSLRITPGFASWATNRIVEDGEGLQVTLTEPKKLYKGLAECVSRQRWDIIAYLGKKQLHSLGDTVTFQVMQELHPSDTEYRDVQSVTALDEAEHLEELAVESMHRFRGALSDAGRVGADLDRIINAMTPEDLNDVEDPAWALIQAHRVGLPVTDIPWCRRRLIGFFFKAMLNMTKFRVPLTDLTVGLYGAVDRSAFNEDGLIDVNRAVLSKNECVMPFKADRGGEVGIIRRPIANKNEQSFANAVRYAREITKKCPYIYLALDLVPAMVKTHGGMDWDDRLQICMDPVEIARRKQSLVDVKYPRYAPEVKEPVVEKKVEDLIKKLKASNPFLRESEMLAKRAVARDPMDSLRQVMNAVMGRRGGITIEGASNRIIVDNANLNNGEVEVPQLYRVSADLEAIIDNTVHVSSDGLAKDSIARDIDEFDRTLISCEEALVGRLPKQVWIDGEMVPVRDRVKTYKGKLTIAKLTIQERQKQFMALLTEETGVRIRSAFPVLLESVVETKEAREVINEMSRFWAIRMANDVDENGKPVPVLPENVKRRVRGELVEIYKQRGWDLEQRDVRARFEDDLGIEAYKVTQKELYLEFDGKPNTLQAVAVGLKRAYCEGRGGDGKFSGNHTVRWFIAVWNDLTFRPEYGDLSAEPQIEVLGEVAVRTPKGAAPAPVVAAVSEAPVVEPAPVVEERLIVPVVAGLERKYGCADAPEAIAFRKRVGTEAELVHCLHLSEETGEYEDAVLVMAGAVDGSAFTCSVTDEDFIAAYGEESLVGYVARPYIRSILALGQAVVNCILEAGGPFSLKAVAC